MTQHKTSKKPKATNKVNLPRPRPNSSFAGYVHSMIEEAGRKTDRFDLQNEPLVRLAYSDELEIKNEALAKFWRKHELPGFPERVRESPKPRRYRTTSQRKTMLKGSRFQLLFGDTRSDIPKKAFVESLLEPRAHKEIYVFLQKKLSEPENRVVAAHLNYLIIRGNYQEYGVIFNVDLLSGVIVRRLKIIAGQLQKQGQNVRSAFIYLDPTKSGYYLENKKVAVPVQFKKLFGPSLLNVEHDGVLFQFHPTSFSQVNESMVPLMLGEARALLAPSPDSRLVDLYCGYGLFSCYFCNSYKQVYAIEADGTSIQSAKNNAQHIPGKSNIRFLAGRITADLLDSFLPNKPMQETIILDPPRQGPKEGVIEALCRRKPHAVLHIFCGVDQIPVSLHNWKKGGYGVERVVPLDMFPGTVNLEVLVLLSPVRD